MHMQKRDRTDEFSFVLKPSTVCDGVGVFASHDIAKGTRLRLFGNHVEDGVDRPRVFFDRAAVPETFRGFCVDEGERLLCPHDFGEMPVGWYVNHSDDPNAVQTDRKWFWALRDIVAGEEILLDYRTLGEPKDRREGFLG
jgi:hypothetical protein